MPKAEEEGPKPTMTQAASPDPTPAPGSESPPAEPGTFELPETVVSKAKWTRTDLHFKGGYSGGYWVRDDEGRLAVWKPGVKRDDGSIEAFREFVCSVVASWVGANVPPVLLQDSPDLGPCSVCPHVAGTSLQYMDVMLLPIFPDLRTPAKEALVEYIGRLVVLDALVGAEDRGNDQNHIFVEETRAWHSLDYGLSFHAEYAERWIGHPDTPYVQPYLSDIRDAARSCGSVMSAALTAATHIPSDRFEELVLLPPQAFASDEERLATVAFLLSRQSRLQEIVERWWSVVGLPGTKR